MRRKFFYALVCFSTLLCVTGCKNGNKGSEEKPEGEMAKQEYTVEKNEVTVVPLERRSFNKQLVCNGRLEAVQRSSVSFQSSGVIASIKVKEGDAVKKGAALAELDRESLESSMKSAQLSYDKSVITLADRLLDYGFTLADTASIPADTRRTIYINTGYADAMLSYENAQRNLRNAVLKAPFAGKVVSIKAKEYENAGGVFCTMIDDSYMTVRFNVLETEYGFVKLGQNIKVTPFNDNRISISGTVMSINPSVDNNGQIAVTARVRNDGNLLDGMNVKVIIENTVPGKLVVPKSAVVIRDNMEVMFRYVAGRSLWTYVHVLMSNTEEYVIEANEERGASISVGDTVIVSGNLNLGDDTPVKLTEK